MFTVESRFVRYALATGLAIGATACAGESKPSVPTVSHKTVQPNIAPPAATAPDAPNTLKLLNIEGLAVGDKLSEVDILQPPKQGDVKRKYAPSNPDASEDLVVFYSPKLSKLMKESVGIHDTSEGVAFLITSLPTGEAAVSLVFFETDTKTVVGIETDSQPLKEGEQPLYRNVHTPEEIGFSVSVISDWEDSSVTLIVEEVLPGSEVS